MQKKTKFGLWLFREWDNLTCSFAIYVAAIVAILAATLIYLFVMGW